MAQAHALLDFGNHRIREDVLYFNLQRKSKTHAVKIARTVILEAGQEYLVKGSTHLRGPVKGDVMLSPTKGFVERQGVIVA